MWPELTLPAVSQETELEQLRREKEQLEEEIRTLETDLAKTKAVAPEKKKD
jgi:cell division protein FtsB